MERPTTWWLEMRDPAWLRPRRSSRPGIRMVEVAGPAGAFAAFLYAAVGAPHRWTDRAEWSAEHWATWLARPEVDFWVLLERGAPAGYYQLEGDGAGAVEVAYLGLLPEFQGRGLGAHLLSHALERAWARRGTRRVWVTTNSWDGPAARANYEARGLRLVHTS